MPKRQPRQQSEQIPQWGLIASGPLRGWRFSFIQLVKVQQGSGATVHIDLRCTPPNWPFPTDVRFNPDRDDIELIPGPRARHLDLAQLVRLAMEFGFARAAQEDRR